MQAKWAEDTSLKIIFKKIITWLIVCIVHTNISNAEIKISHNSNLNLTKNKQKHLEENVVYYPLPVIL